VEARLEGRDGPPVLTRLEICFIARSGNRIRLSLVSTYLRERKQH
jgi:hypothetical protein